MDNKAVARFVGSGKRSSWKRCSMLSVSSRRHFSPTIRSAAGVMSVRAKKCGTVRQGSANISSVNSWSANNIRRRVSASADKESSSSFDKLRTAETLTKVISVGVVYLIHRMHSCASVARANGIATWLSRMWMCSYQILPDSCRAVASVVSVLDFITTPSSAHRFGDSRAIYFSTSSITACVTVILFVNALRVGHCALRNVTSSLRGSFPSQKRPNNTTPVQ